MITTGLTDGSSVHVSETFSDGLKCDGFRGVEVNVASVTPERDNVYDCHKTSGLKICN